MSSLSDERRETSTSKVVTVPTNLSEKLLISKCRPKMYVVKLRSSCGPEAQQRGLKGNTITFPQDTVKIAATLPANPEILVDHLKVVFIGKGRPSREMLKKNFTVLSN